MAKRKLRRTLKHPVGSRVFYRAFLGHIVRGVVRHNGGNGRLWVEPYFERRNGKDIGCFIGGKPILVLTASLVEEG
jgi:hypothetical protein